MPIITKIVLRQAANSLKKATVLATVFSGRVKAEASTPSGTSAGTFEACFAPKPVPELILLARRFLVPRLEGEELEMQRADTVIREADGTQNFSRIGAAVSTAVSAAVAKCVALKQGQELYEYLNPKPHAKYCVPRLLCKMIGGGAHALHGPTIQEFLVILQTDGFVKNVKACRMLHSLVGKRLKSLPVFRRELDIEGGWTGSFSNEQALTILRQSAAGFEKTGIRAMLGIDAAASTTRASGKKEREYLLSLAESYQLSYVEDPFHEQAFKDFAVFARQFKGLTVADDLTVTNPARLKHAIRLKASNAVIIKPNQAGLLSQACETMRLAEKHGLVAVPSHRSGETSDNTIVHLAVAFSSPLIKLTLAGRERTAKIRELLRIEKKLNQNA